MVPKKGSKSKGTAKNAVKQDPIPDNPNPSKMPPELTLTEIEKVAEEENQIEVEKRKVEEEANDSEEENGSVDDLSEINELHNQRIELLREKDLLGFFEEDELFTISELSLSDFERIYFSLLEDQRVAEDRQKRIDEEESQDNESEDDEKKPPIQAEVDEVVKGVISLLGKCQAKYQQLNVIRKSRGLRDQIRNIRRISNDFK